MLDGSRVVAEDGLVVVQIHPREYEPVELLHLELTDQRKYGSTTLCFYEVRPGQYPSAVATPESGVSNDCQSSAEPTLPQSDCSAGLPEK